jgi:hypothetical protein
MAEAAFDSDDVSVICDALIRSALHDPDWAWVEEHCLVAAHHRAPEVRTVAATSLGHLARLYGTLHLDRVIPVLETLREDAAAAGTAQDALDDIRMFVPEFGSGPG